MTNDDTYNPFAVIASPSKLTKLDVRIAKLIWPENNNELMTQFGNLKSFMFFPCRPPYGRYPRMFQYMTALESLELWQNCPQDDIFALTRLTHLHLRPNKQTSPVHFDVLNFSAFQNLKSLTLDASIKTESDYIFLQSLTVLECFKMLEQQAANGLKYLNSQKLTCLEMNMTEEFNMDYLCKLTTVLDLYFFEVEGLAQKNYDGLSSLTSLQSLFISMETLDAVRFTILNSLTNLKELYLRSNDLETKTTDALPFQELVNLHTLSVSRSVSQSTYDNLRYLTALTYLDVNFGPEVFQNNPTVLDMLSLQTLCVERDLRSQQLWDIVTRLSNLICLTVCAISSEEVVESFSVLTNLTNLMVLESNLVKGVYLPKLTSLQALYFYSEAAKMYHQDIDLLTETLTRLSQISFE